MDGPILTLATAARAGLRKAQVYALVESGELKRIGRGVFVDPDLIDPAWTALAAATALKTEATLCLTSALVYHDLSDAIGFATDIALPRGTRHPAGFDHVSWHSFDPATFKVGRTFLEQDGLTLAIYSAERTIIDCFRLAHQGRLGSSLRGAPSLGSPTRQPALHTAGHGDLIPEGQAPDPASPRCAAVTPTPTRDIDLQASGFANDVTGCERRIRDIAAIPQDDGLTFDTSSVRGEVIREESEYNGVRVHVEGTLASARIAIHVDINSIAHLRAITEADLSHALTTVADHRQATLSPLAESLSGMAEVAQPKWLAWRRRQCLATTTPERFQELLERCAAFADPVLSDAAGGLVWDPGTQNWS